MLERQTEETCTHKEFLTCCVAEELVPKGLEVALEPTVGNHDQEFLDNWYSKEKQFSLSLMKEKDIVQFCDRTVHKSAQDIIKTESSLKRNASQSQHHAIQTEINANEDSTKKVLQQRKFKKNIALRVLIKQEFKKNKTICHTIKMEKTLYPDILKRTRSKTDVERKSRKTKISTTTQHKTTIEQQKALNIKNDKGKLPSLSNSSTNQS